MSEASEPVRVASKIIFDDNLQTFKNKIANIIALESGGKLTPEDAYKRIKALWKDLKRSKKSLLK